MAWPSLCTDTTRLLPLVPRAVMVCTSSWMAVPAPVARLLTLPMSAPAASEALWPLMGVPLPPARMDPAADTPTAPWLAPATTLTSVRSPLLVDRLTLLPALSALACTRLASVGPALRTDTAPPLATTDASVVPALRASSMKMPLPLLAVRVAALVCRLVVLLPTPAVPLRFTTPPVTRVLWLPSSCRRLPAPLALSVSTPLPASRLPANRLVSAVLLLTLRAPPLDAAWASSRSALWVMSMAPPADATDDSTEGVDAVR